MNEKDKSVGERIFLLRSKRGYSREKLVELAKISSKFLYEIEIGKKGFSISVLCNLCEALEVSSDYILNGQIETSGENEFVMTLDFFKEEEKEYILDILKCIRKLVE